jgi:hypothetical protein
MKTAGTLYNVEVPGVCYILKIMSTKVEPQFKSSGNYFNMKSNGHYTILVMEDSIGELVRIMVTDEIGKHSITGYVTNVELNLLCKGVA